jgi:DNA end-binding protein Ku
MARAIWSGAISFGLVNVPVRLFTATESKTVRFHQFDKNSGQRVRNLRVTEDSGEEVAYDDIVKGYELEKGRFVIVEPEELEAVEPGPSRSIEIEDFVDLHEVDPIYFGSTYYLSPGEGGAEKPYALLKAAMEESGKIAIARFVMRGKQHLAAIRPSGPVLVLSTMYFPDEVRAPDVVGDVPETAEVSPRERTAAVQLVESLTSEWEPERYQDTYRERVLDLVHRKAEGEEIVDERPAAQEGTVVDLMAALEASVRAARGDREARGGAGREAKASGSSAKGGGGSARGGAPSWDEMSKDELYEEAQKRKLPGRSKMTRDELVEALSDGDAGAHAAAS